MATASQTRWHEDGGAAAHPGDYVEDVTPSGGVEGARGLVQDQDVGFVDEGLRQAQPLAHPAGVSTDAAFGRGSQHGLLEGLVDSGLEVLTLNAEQSPDKLEELASGHPVVKPGVLVEMAYSPSEREAAVLDVVAEDEGLPSGGCVKGGQQADRRRLPGSVGTQEAEDGAGGHLKGEAVEGDEIAEALDKPLAADRGFQG